MSFLLHMLVYLNVFCILAIGLNLVVGYAGYLNLAHAAYFATGSYCYGLATTRLGCGVFMSIVLAIAGPVACSLALAIPSWRFKGDSFVLLSLAVQALFFSAIYNWFSPGASLGTWTNLTNGPFGISGIPKPDIFGVKFATVGYMAVFAMSLATSSILLCWILVRSPFGQLLKAIRDDELAARGLGKNVPVGKLWAFAICCGTAGLAGAIYAAYVGYIDPSLGTIDQSVLMLCMVVVGGAGNFRGPLVGAIILVTLPELLRFLDLKTSAAADIRLLAYGLLLILLMHWRPQGLAGRYSMDTTDANI